MHMFLWLYDIHTILEGALSITLLNSQNSGLIFRTSRDQVFLAASSPPHLGSPPPGPPLVFTSEARSFPTHHGPTLFTSSSKAWSGSRALRTCRLTSFDSILPCKVFISISVFHYFSISEFHQYFASQGLHHGGMRDQHLQHLYRRVQPSRWGSISR